MKNYEYKTTYGTLYYPARYGGEVLDPDCPIMPEADKNGMKRTDWELASSVVSDNNVIWFWKLDHSKDVFE